MAARILLFLSHTGPVPASTFRSLAGNRQPFVPALPSPASLSLSLSQPHESDAISGSLDFRLPQSIHGFFPEHGWPPRERMSPPPPPLQPEAAGINRSMASSNEGRPHRLHLKLQRRWWPLLEPASMAASPEDCRPLSEPTPPSLSPAQQTYSLSGKSDFNELQPY
uniref:Uncharacterized protein n=1 Tax=Opuntia streptacantha TaxID=393608 RepID=A0A7C9B0P5_OPUST